jgi:small subunit ribosomal protein S6
MSQLNSTRSYKASFIFDTRGYQEPLETLYERIKEKIEATGATVTDIDHLGQKEFARVTHANFPAGLYSTYYFDAPATAPSAIKEKLRLESTINRVFIQSC